MIDEHTVLYMPARMSFDDRGGSDIDALFHETGPMLALSEWLDQKLFSREVSLREFIRSLADRESAHADPTPNETLEARLQAAEPPGISRILGRASSG
jgi:hypothetical protein